MPLLLLLLLDLLVPFLIVVGFAGLLRKWPAWTAWAAMASVYLAWANLVARTLGYSLSIYMLVGVSLSLAPVLGPPSELDRNELFFWYPLIGLVVVPTLLLCGTSVACNAWHRLRHPTHSLE